MPVSPQDFALWSDLTGNPYPRTPAERMALAPHVYDFTRRLGRQGGPTMSPIRQAIDVIGKTALGLGALAGAAYLGKEHLGKTSKEETEAPISDVDQPKATEPAPEPKGPKATTSEIIDALAKAKTSPRRPPTPEVEQDAYDTGAMDLYLEHQQASHRRNVSEKVQKFLQQEKPVLKTPAPQGLSSEELINRLTEKPSISGQHPYIEQSILSRTQQLLENLKGSTQLELDDEPGVPAPQTTGAGGPLSQVERASGDITEETTAGQYHQNLINNQTTAVQSLKGLSPVKPTQTPIEAKPVTQSEVIATQQSFSPGTEHEMVGENAARKAEAFRKSAAYAAMQKEYPSLRPIESPSAPATQPAVVLTEVEPKPEVSPVAAMVTPAKAPVTASVPTGAGPTAQESREFMDVLNRGAAHLTPEQKQLAHDDYFAKKYKSTSPVVEAAAPAPPIDVPSGPSAESVQFAREAARGVSRMGLLASQEAGRARTMTQARLGKALAEATGLEESGEMASPRLMGQMLRRPTAVEIPSAPVTVARPTSFGRPAATTPGTEEHLVAQAIEHLEGSKQTVPGSFSQDIPGGDSIKNITMYPGNNISVTYKSDPLTAYPFKVHPAYADELKTALQQGHFMPGGPHSAGGFIQAGINMGLLR